MSADHGSGLTPTGTISSPGDRKRVVFATIIGTTIEWYDFFTYAILTPIALAPLFFAEVGGPNAGIWAFATIGLSFLFRPFGAFLAGHFGDKFGRRRVLVITLFGMGIATALIGVLPTYATVGILAPILLILLRIVQGISAGGEWGGAVLMAVEHAPKHKRGIFGASPQMGVPLGLILASIMIAVVSNISGEQWLEWGWRIPFLFSIILVFVGWWIRRSVDESPVFAEIAERAAQTKMPLVQLFKKHWLLVILLALVFVANNAAGYMTTGGFLQGMTSKPIAEGGQYGYSRESVMWAVVCGAVIWLIFTFVGGWLSDRIGRRKTYIIGWVFLFVGVLTLFPLIQLGTWESFAGALMVMSVGLGMTYGQQAAFYAEAYPASIRFSGVSIAYAIGAILGGAFAPTIAEAIVVNTGSTTGITWYLAALVIVSLLATLMLKDRTGIPLGPDHEAEQSVSPIYGVSKA